MKSYIRQRCLYLLLAVASPAFAQNNEKTVALVGIPFHVKPVEEYVVNPLGYASDVFDMEPPSVHDYKNYRAVILVERFWRENASPNAVWDSEENLEVVRDYVRNGGKVIILAYAWPHSTAYVQKKRGAERDLKPFDDLLGFSRYPRTTPINPVTIHEPGKSIFSGHEKLDLVTELTQCVDEIKNAEILATAADELGGGHPFATRNTFGKGAVYFFGTSPFRLANEIRKSGGEGFETRFLPYAKALQNAITE